MSTAKIIIGYDSATLHPIVDEDAVAARLDEIESRRDRESLEEKTMLYAYAGLLDDAWNIAQESVRLSRFSGSREEVLAARYRRAVVQHYRGKVAEAIGELSGCALEASNHGWALAEASAMQQRGVARFDLLDYRAALADFEGALALRNAHAGAPDAVEASRFAIGVAQAKVRENAFGGDGDSPAPLF